MKDLFDEKTVIELGDKILKELAVRIKKEIGDKFYNEYEQYLYEIYDNATDEIKNRLIRKMADKFIENPNEYKYEDLRKKLWEENKEKLTKTLTDEAIQKNLETIILEFTNKKHHFDWHWLDGIVNVIMNNWDRFKNNKRIEYNIQREITRLKDQVKYLKKELADERGEMA